MLRRQRLLGAGLLLAILGLGSVPAGTVLADDGGAAIEAVGPGNVNWTTGLVTAVGIGAPPEHAANKAQARAMAERAAFSVAIRNLLEVVKGIQVDSATLVENMIVSNDLVKTRVTGLVKGAQPLKKEVQPDGAVEVTVGVSLTGELVDIVIAKDFGRKAPASIPAKPAPPAPTPKAPEAPAPAAKPAIPPPAQPPAQPMVSADSYTGLLVDARGLGLRPALAPRFLDEQGKELYASEVLDRNQAVQGGVAGYAKDLVAGSRQPRVTDNPLVVKAVRATGTKATDIVLGADSVKAIQQSEPSAHFLQQGRVVVIYD
jgi:hypothetical protein